MKWFKHLSTSLDDPFIFELLDKFGADGYLVFFGILEIYSKEFKDELDWKLNVTHSYLKQKLHKRQATLIIKILKHIENSGKWEVELKDSEIVVFISRYKEIMDNWSRKKLRSDSVVTPDNSSVNKELRTKTKDIKKVIKNKDIVTNLFFNSVWDLYPKKMGKSSVSATKRKELEKVGYDSLKAAIDNYKSTIVGEDIKYIKHGSSFFNSSYVDFLPESYESPVESYKYGKKKESSLPLMPIKIVNSGKIMGEDY